MKKMTAGTELKQKNRSNIYKAFRENKSLTRQDLVSKLDLSLPTVTQNLQELQNEGLICENGTVGNTGGRRAKTYSIVSDAKTAIGIEITMHHIVAVAIDLCGRIITSLQRRETFSRTDEYYRVLGDMVDAVISNAGLSRENILGVGFGVQGLITEDNQTVFYGEILHFTGMTCSEFTKYIDLPAALFNDANASCFAEMWINPDLRNAFYIMLSNSVGGAIYIDRQQYNGENIRAGEVGHIIIVPGGKKCYCGQRGCLDPYCTATMLSSLTDGNLAAFFEILDQGDPHAAIVWDEYLTHLATAVSDIRMLFDCPVIIGGYVGIYIDKYLNDLKSRIAGKSSFENNADYILPCRFKTEAIATGAALNFIQKFLSTI